MNTWPRQEPKNPPIKKQGLATPPTGGPEDGLTHGPWYTGVNWQPCASSSLQDRNRPGQMHDGAALTGLPLQQGQPDPWFSGRFSSGKGAAPSGQNGPPSAGVFVHKQDEGRSSSGSRAQGLLADTMARLTEELLAGSAHGNAEDEEMPCASGD